MRFRSVRNREEKSAHKHKHKHIPNNNSNENNNNEEEDDDDKQLLLDTIERAKKKHIQIHNKRSEWARSTEKEKNEPTTPAIV